MGQHFLRSFSASPRTGKLLGLLCGHSSQMSQIALVSYEHDHNVRVCMVSELLQPPRDVVICLMLADVVDKKSTDRSSVVCRCDCAISLLTCCVPYLCLDRLCVDLDRSGCELDSDRRLGIEIEFVSCETAQQVGFADT